MVSGCSFAPTNCAGSKPSKDPSNDHHAESDMIVDPLLKYLNNSDTPQQRQSLCPYFNVDDAIEALKTEGYYHIPSVLTNDECNEALDNLWDFIENVSGGVVQRSDPMSWYPQNEVSVQGSNRRMKQHDAKYPIVNNNLNKNDDIDPWPHTGYTSFPDMFQSLGAGFVLGNVREILAKRIFEPLFGTRELLSSKEGFTFCRPLVVELEGGNEEAVKKQQLDTASKQQTNEEINCKNNILVWKSNRLNSSSVDGESNLQKERLRPLFRVCSQPQPNSEGQHYDQGVPASALLNHTDNHTADLHATTIDGHKRDQRRQLNKQQRYKDTSGLCHIQASISFTDQTIDRHRGGGHFLCHPYSHSSVHWKLVGGTYRATPAANPKDNRPDPTWVPLTDDEICQLAEMECPERRIYAQKGDVILWRSDLAHAGVAPSLMTSGDAAYDGPRQFRAVGYCSMLPIQAVKDYTLYSLPRHEVMRNSEKLHLMLAKEDESLTRAKLEAYKMGHTGDHRPNVEIWHKHRRLPAPRRMLQRPKLTVRQAELYGLLQYHQPTNQSRFDEEFRRKDIEHAVIRGVRFVEQNFAKTYFP